MVENRKNKKRRVNSNARLNAEKYEEYFEELYGMEFIAGFTENGEPYGIFESDIQKASDEIDEDLPF